MNAKIKKSGISCGFTSAFPVGCNESNCLGLLYGVCWRVSNRIHSVGFWHTITVSRWKWDSSAQLQDKDPLNWKLRELHASTFQVGAWLGWRRGEQRERLQLSPSPNASVWCILGKGHASAEIWLVPLARVNLLAIYSWGSSFFDGVRGFVFLKYNSHEAFVSSEGSATDRTPFTQHNKS